MIGVKQKEQETNMKSRRRRRPWRSERILKQQNDDDVIRVCLHFQLVNCH